MEDEADRTESKALPFLSKFRNLASYSKKVNWKVFILLSFFTISSWVSANSVWSELPFYINESPEGWRLTSVLTLLAQISQIFPMTVFLWLRKFFPDQVTYRKSIYFKLFVEVLACTLLGFFWDYTIIIKGRAISLGLYILSFTMSLLCGLSSVTYLPYIGEHFSKQYIVPLYIGESVSSTIPSIIVFFQGSTIPDESKCNTEITVGSLKSSKDKSEFLDVSKKQYFVHQKQRNISSIKNLTSEFSQTNLTLKTEPYFSVSVFFFIMACLMLLCMITFIYIDINYAKSKKLKLKKDTDIKMSKIESKEEETLIRDLNEADKSIEQQNKKLERNVLLFISFLIACFMYGVLPGIQPYSTLPYGYTPFHLSINLGNLLLPIAVFSSIFSKKDSMRKIFWQFLLGLVFSCYLLFISIMSPCPPFVNSHPGFGAFMSVFSWILVECLFIRLRCKIAERFEKFGGESFLFLGFVTLFGQVVGGTLIYICIDIYNLFLDKPPCISSLSYCSAKTT